MGNVWCADDTFFDDLIYLGNENLIVDSPDTETVPKIRDALLAGQSPASVLSSSAVNIPLHAVTRISTDLNDEDIEIHYKNDNEDKEKTLRLANPEKRDEVFAALKVIYGEKFEAFEEKFSVPQAVSNPLLALTIFGMLTWLFAKGAAALRAAEEYEISGSKRGIKALFAWVLELLGPIGVSVVGGIICLLCALAVFNGVKEPPELLTLQAPPYKRRSTLALIAKYVFLVALWALIARVATA